MTRESESAAHFDCSQTKRVLNRKSGQFEPEKLEDHYETVLTDITNK